jgi:hypothetical protein
MGNSGNYCAMPEFIGRFANWVTNPGIPRAISGFSGQWPHLVSKMKTPRWVFKS